MKLTIKTLQQSTFTVVTEPDKTVKDLKAQIELEKGKDFPCSAQKLIYSGKILADESKLSEYNIDEKKFIVLMITRPPPAPKPPTIEKPVSNSTVKTETNNAESKAKPTDDKPSTRSNTTTSSSATTSVSATLAATNLTSNPSANQPATRSSARLSTNPPPVAPAPTTAPASNNEASILSAMSEPQLATRLAMLMSQPQFRQIQDHIQQSPHLLSQTIESLAASDPEMYNFISENPDVFVNALNHPPMGRSHASNRPGEQGGRASDGQGVRQGPGVEQLIGNVSEHDKEAIERLMELGFSEMLAVQAYMACDKDEQLAADLLFQMDQ